MVRLVLAAVLVGAVAACAGCAASPKYPVDTRPEPPPLAPEPAGPSTVSLAGVRVAVPPGWRADPAGDGWNVISGDRHVIVMLLPIPTGDLDAAWKAARTALPPGVTQSLLEAPSPVEVGGMRALRASGRGMLDGAPVDLLRAAVRSPAGQVLSVLRVAGRPISEETERAGEALVEGLRPE